MKNQNQQVLCRIQNLTSAKGGKLNGSAACFDPTKKQQDGRLAVTIDGVPDQLSLKPANLYILEPFMDMAVAVGRTDLRSDQFMATTIDQKLGKRVTVQLLPADGTALRSKGTLIALNDYLRQHRIPEEKDAVIHLTDLNLARLFNTYVAQQNTTQQLSASQQPLANTAGKYLMKRNHKKGGILLFKYQPFRIHRGDRPATGRLEAVLNSKFHIYPCPCNTFLDSLEVRFVISGRSTHEFFLDFGQDETIQYVKNAHCMQEVDRLKPETLADVDPQLFWSSVLHSKVVVKTLKNLEPCPDDLIQRWSNIYRCYIQSSTVFKENVFSASEAVRLLPDPQGRWNLINDEIHRNIATRNAKLAIVLSTDWLAAGVKQGKGFSIELMDNYKGTEIDEVMQEFFKALKSQDPQDIDFAFQNITSWKETKTCDHCGKYKKDMFWCKKCKGVSYCDRECQIMAWKSHKKICKDLKAGVDKEEASKEATKHPIPVKVKMYKPHRTRNTPGPQIYSECCGLGILRILWCGNSTNEAFHNKNCLSWKPVRNNTIFKTEVAALGGGQGANSFQMLLDATDAKVFRDDLSNLDPITRLCLSCGPLADLKLAQSSLDDAMRQAQGSVANLKMPWIGFTPLEWAAKKGHLEIVKWLLAEPRTKALVNNGSPVGWASYTNRVEIARLLVDKGASPEATDEIYWDGRPPLLAAAENGMIDAVKFLVQECGVNIKATKWKGNGIVAHIKMSPNWKEQKGHRTVLDYAKKKLKG